MLDLNKIGSAEAGQLQQAQDRGQLSHAYLLLAGDEAEALNTAYWLICYANCEGENKPDGTCPACQRILSGNHPDVMLIDTEENRQTIAIDQVRTLKQELAKSPAEGDRRYFVINHAQKLTLPAANALLNLLEEPVAPVVTFLIASNGGQILPTIRSRTQIINFSQQPASSRESLLLENGMTQAEVDQIKDSSQVDQAVKYFYQELQEHDPLAIVSAHQLAALVKKQKQGTKAWEKYVWILLKKWAEKELTAGNVQQAAAFLADLLQIDQMRQSNVGFLNNLDYLALKWQQ
ncbi:DNA polymerase III subunit delta [Lactobacillus nasalidis]|uniref:DNA polymerase III subunit delta n=1 Tax=Lactobacillus nasalidis TaxID=2797258 RepID=A0ABQ3W5Q1_9LACO|nr:DNA polymerase III subunit delta [Lactobacillus nasalidis]GHW01878.1 DNA polymerase III subunit delta [Lactobacillus nasalidis]